MLFEALIELILGATKICLTLLLLLIILLDELHRTHGQLRYMTCGHRRGPICLRESTVALQARLSILECGNNDLHGRCPRVVLHLGTLLELILGTTKFRLSLLLLIITLLLKGLPTRTQC